MPRTVETAFNGALASVLRSKHPRWKTAVSAEQTGVLRDSAGAQPDIIVRHPGGMAVVIETEYEPARTVEADARNRLGRILEPEGELMEAAVAVRIPGQLGEGSGDLLDGIRAGTFLFCTFSGTRLPGDPVRRWPRSGWLRGGIDELADCIEQVSLSEQRIDRGAEILERAVRNTARTLQAATLDRSPEVLRKLADCLRQEEGEQTTRMAMAILLNALIFQSAIAGDHDIEDPSSLRGARGKASKIKVLDSWRQVLTINYWPIFKIARDLVIMNPPFTRPTNHESTTVPVPSFAGFATSRSEQAVMSRRLAEYRRALAEPAGHGNAGLAFNFADLAHAKLRPGGVAAFVLPAAFVQGGSWRNARDLFAGCYEGLTVVSIADTGQSGRAFSADTGMAEVLVVGRKTGHGESDTLFANLRRRPRSILEAVSVARRIGGADATPTGRIPLTDADEAGVFVRTELQNGGASGILEAGLARTMLALPEGRLKLPRRNHEAALPVARLSEIGSRGLLDRDISGNPEGNPPRGPFDILPLLQGAVPTYPTLWGHSAARERHLIVQPDTRAEPRPACRERAAEAWRRHATNLHFNRDFRINSQPLAACLTPGKALGGRAWPNFKLHDEPWETPVLLWSNTTLGLMSFWWLGARQQQGRAILTLSTLPNLPVLDPRRLTGAQHAAVVRLFADFRDREFLPANEAYRDETRQALDRAVLVDLLGLPDDAMEPLDLLRRQWCAEPTVHGGKSTRPRTGGP